MQKKSAHAAGKSSPMRNARRAHPRRLQPQNAGSGPTVERILDGARRILIENGYAAFTTRRVAEAVGMTVGNLTYHFPSKRELLRALIGKLLADYSRRFEVILADRDAPEGKKLENLVRWLFRTPLMSRP